MKRYFEKFLRERRSLTRLYKTHYAIHGRITRFSHSTSVVRLRCCVDEGIRPLVCIVFQENRRSIDEYRPFLWRPRWNHSSPLHSRDRGGGRPPLDVRGMKWNDDAWLIRCRPPTRIDNRVIRDNRPFLIEFQTISLSLSFNEEVAS